MAMDHPPTHIAATGRWGHASLRRPRAYNAVALVALSLGAASPAQATIITYDFTSAVGNGSFSFDDSNTTTVSQPPAVSAGATWYSAIDFVIDGINVASPVIGVYDNLGSVDCLSVIASAGFP